MPMRRNPFEELEELFDRMSRQFQEPEEWSSMLSGLHDVSVDVADHPEEFVVTADLPGFDKEDIDLRFSGETLHVRARRGEERETGEENYIRRERRQESVSRSVRVPEPVDEDAISANYQNGVLTVTLPKREPREGGEHIEIS